MTTNSQLSRNKNKNKLSKQLEREQIQWGEGEGKMGEKLQGIKSINGRYKIDKGRLRIVWEMDL